MSRWLVNIPKDGDSTTSPGNLCQCLVTFTVKKCFLMLRGNFPCFSLCPLPLVLSLGTTEQSLSLSSLHPPFRYLCTFMRSLWAFFSPGWTVPALPTSPYRRDAPVPSSSLQPLAWLCSMSVSLLYWKAHNRIQDSSCSLTSSDQGVRIIFLDTLITFPLMQSRVSSAFFITRTHCWLTISLVSTRSPGAFSV